MPGVSGGGEPDPALALQHDLLASAGDWAKTSPKTDSAFPFP